MALHEGLSCRVSRSIPGQTPSTRPCQHTHPHLIQSKREMCQEPQNKFRDLLPPHAGIKTLPNSESQTGLCGPVTQAGRRPRSPALTPRPAGRRAFPGAGPQHNRASLQLRSGLVLIAHLNPEANKVTEGSTLGGGSFPSCTPHQRLPLLNWPTGAASFTSKPSRARDPPSGAPRAAWAT